VTITGCSFTNNDSNSIGGAIYATNNSLSVDGVTFSNNTAAATGGGAIAAFAMTSFNVQNSRFDGNQAVVDGGAISISSSQPVIISGNVFTGNLSTGSGAALFFNGMSTATVTNNVFGGNIAQAAGGGLYVNGTAGKSLIANNNKFVGNSPDGIYVDIGNTIQEVKGNCFAGNGVGLYGAFATIGDISGNYWGAANGPSGEQIGDGDAINISNQGFGPPITIAPTVAGELCPSVLPDFYSVEDGSVTTFDATVGLLANDNAIQPGTAAVLEQPATANSVVVNPDGSFTFTSVGGTGTIDGFRYSVTDLEGTTVEGLACVTLSNVQIAVPPPQNTTLGNPIPIPGVQVSINGSTTGTDLVDVQLSVSLGALSLGVTGNGGTATTPADDCKATLDGLRTTSSNIMPDVVRGPSSTPYRADGVRLMSGSRPIFAPYAQPTVNVAITGNGTQTLTVSGQLTDVNVALSTLTYTPGSVGVDPLVVVANDGVSFAANQTVIIVGGVSQTASNTTTTTTTTGISAPTGPLTLFEFSQLPGSVIIGSAPTGTIPNGDVFVELLVVQGDFRVPPEQIGETALTGSVTNAAEIYGLTFTGVSVAPFEGSAEVCLLGSGSYFYRDA
ncbi:MAG: right-handed parallel beta-helix repeat-containing protein, partial [Chloroflexota bacterium]